MKHVVSTLAIFIEFANGRSLEWLDRIVKGMFGPLKQTKAAFTVPTDEALLCVMRFVPFGEIIEILVEGTQDVHPAVREKFVWFFF